MQPTYPPEAEAYRDEIRSFLAEHLPPDWRGLGALDRPDQERFLDEWRQVLAEHRLVALAWPREYGGAGLSLLERVVLHEEFAKAGVPFGKQTDFIGVTLVGNAILACGTEEQKREWLPKIVSGEHVWCQGYSEPDAGSDLASLKTRAVLDGDEWVITGQKIWTTEGHKANWILVLARTNPAASNTKGISFLLCPMDQPGVEVRPIINMNDGHEFNEVFLTEARTRRDHIVGEVDGGWAVANVLLAFERGDEASTVHIHYREELDRLVALARARGGAAHPVVRQELARAHSAVEILRWVGLRTLTSSLAGRPLGPESSLAKLLWSEHHQRVTNLALHVLGAEALAPSGPRPFRSIGVDAAGSSGSSASWVGLALGARAASIYSGSNEIQRNILAERVLGLAREPR